MTRTPGRRTVRLPGFYAGIKQAPGPEMSGREKDHFAWMLINSVLSLE